MARARTLPPLHAVTDARVLARADFLERARALLAAGGPRLALHVRGPGLPARRLLALADALRPEAEAHGAWLLVHDRLDVAQAVEADGVQLPQTGLPAAVARRLLGPHRIIGVSVHSRAEADASLPEADFWFVGPIYATASHPGHPGAGPALLAAMPPVRPRVAIGGVTPERVAELRRAGAVGVAVLRGLWDAPEPALAATVYLARWSDADGDNDSGAPQR